MSAEKPNKKTGVWIGIIILVVLFLFFGCQLEEEEAEDGKVFWAISWHQETFTISIDNSDIPDDLRNGKYYKTSPGPYDFEYIAWDDSVWNGFVRILANKVSADGKDGENKYYQLDCRNTGWIVYIEGTE